MTNRKVIFFIAIITLLVSSIPAGAQDNSPYSRYGLGNESPTANIISRGMGGVSAAFNEPYSVNFANPASYARYQAILESRTQKMEMGRVVLDVGVNLSSRTLTPPNQPETFTSTDLFPSHIYVGVPLKKNWGLTFGLRPLHRVGYNVYRSELLRDPATGLPIDSAITQFQGSGGSFLPSIGTGFGSDNFSVGINMGYLFGKKETITRRIFNNDTANYAASNHTTNSFFGGLFFNAGVQYQLELNSKSKLKIGLAGNWKQDLSGTQDLRRYTYVRDGSGGETVIDSVSDRKDVPGTVVYPASFTGGVIYERAPGERVRGWTLGADYVRNSWEQYRFFGATDSVQNNFELRVGAQLVPIATPSRYGQAVTYRFGFFVGQDYIRYRKELPVYGLSFGMGLPVVNYSRLSQNQYTVVNLSFEFARRGNDSNVLKENLFRVSMGLNLTDLWFGKRKYE